LTFRSYEYIFQIIIPSEENVATIEQICSILMEPTDRGMRAVGRALVLLYSKAHRGEHKNPMGVSMAEYYLKYGYLTQKHLDFWRKPLQNGIPHILQHKNELMIFAEFKERRKALNAPRPKQPDIKLLNQQRDLLENALDVKEAPETELFMAALLGLRKFERQHGLTPATIEGILEQDNVVAFNLDHQDNSEYNKHSNGA
jgi:hypothetical protein